jgi:hypothetical protein
MSTIAGSIKDRLASSMNDEDTDRHNGVYQESVRCKTPGCKGILSFYSESHIVGGYCWGCRKDIPTHIPLEQHGMYLDVVNERKKNVCQEKGYNNDFTC